VRQKIARLVHQVDHRRGVWHRHVHVQAEDQQRPRQLLQLLDDVLIALARGDDLIHPVRERMGAGGGDAQAHPLCGVRQIAPGADDLAGQLFDRSTDLGADLDNRLVHLALDVVAEGGRARREQFRDVRSELPGGGIDDLKFFLDADGKGVIHSVLTQRL
jgi:hypothetical protein